MVLTSYMLVLSYISLSASTHFEWDNYHWGQQQQEPQNHPVDGGHYEPGQQTPALPQQDHQAPTLYPQVQQSHQHQQHPGHYQQDQQDQQTPQKNDFYHPVLQNDQFQGYPIHRPIQTVSTMPPPIATVPPTTQITPVPNSVPKEMPKHRLLLRQLYQQVLGPDFTSPLNQQLAFLSSAPSLPLNSQVQNYVQPRPSETQYELAQYVEPPPPPHISDQFNYYS